MNSIKIGKKLKSLREQAKLSAKEVSEILESSYGIAMNHRTLFNYEKGRSSPDIDRFLTLCKIYKCNDILYEFGYSLQKSPIESAPDTDCQLVLKKYQNLSEDGKNIIRNALGIEKVEAEIFEKKKKSS